jgi:hypothetical protein
MPDPAIVAAERALNELIESQGDPGDQLMAVLRDLAISAARTALEYASDVNVATVPLPEPSDTHNHETDTSMCGWEPVAGLPYFVEYLPNGGAGQIEIEHDGKRLTPLPPSAAFDLGASIIAASKLATAG